MINYLIGIAGIAYGIYTLKAKSKKDPNFEISGMRANTLINLGYIGITCFVILIFMSLAD